MRDLDLTYQVRTTQKRPRLKLVPGRCEITRVFRRYAGKPCNIVLAGCLHSEFYAALYFRVAILEACSTLYASLS